MPEILGYTSRLGVTAGEEITLMVSCAAPEFSAELVRVHGPETGFGEGPWFRAEPVGAGPLRAPGVVQRATTGSCGHVAHLPGAGGPDGLTVFCSAAPTLPGDGRAQTLVCLRDGDRAGVRLHLDPGGCLAVQVWAGGRDVLLPAELPLVAGRWHAVAVTVDAGGVVRLWQDGAVTVHPAALDMASWSGVLTLAAADLRGGAPQEPYDGRIARPAVFSRALADVELAALAAGAVRPASVASVVAAWDFAADTGGRRLVDVSGNGHDGELVNLPMLAVTGPGWTGEHDDPRLAPEQYDAAHFHSDDLGDAGWEPSLRIPVPADLRPGLHGVRLRCAGEDTEEDPGEDIVPVWVRRAATAPPAGVVFLASTYTYLAYANDRQHATADFSAVTEDVEFGAADAWLHEHAELGASLYDLHRDGTGFSHSSHLRPILNMRPGYVSWLTGTPRHLSSDLAVLGWLDRQGVPYDVVTDEDLHLEGAEALAGRRVLVTGTHPEYCTGAMLAAVESFVQGGGRLMYLGGNGFYWVTGVSPAVPHAIEVRRGYSGTRTWESAPGECHLAGTGEPGGLWRHRGRPPHRLVGTGFAAMGWGSGCGYRVAEGLPDRIRELLPDGMEPGTVFGEHGFLGGAAGDEVDRADPAQGTPPQTVVLASSTGLGERYQPVVEEQLSILPGLGGSTNPDVRSDVTYTPVGDHGGAVFAASSINWAGALPHDRYRNTVAALTANVLRAFLDGRL